jgi:DHA2 family methylenomycin A resistance protein-like MFS transporter
MNLCTLGMLFVVTLFLQREEGHGPLAAGLLLLPLFAPLTVLAPLTGRVVARVGPWMPMAAGLVVAAAGLALLTAALAPALLLWGVGLGLLTPAVVSAAMDAVERERAGVAAAVNNTARQAGGAVGIAAFGTLSLRAGGLVAAALYLLAALGALATRSRYARRRRR